MKFSPDMAKPVWYGTPAKDSWRLFRSAFRWNGETETLLAVSAESTYDVKINGHHVPVQQISDFPQFRTYAQVCVDEFLHKGENEIRILVHWTGTDLGTAIAGHPYLWAVLASEKQTYLATSKAWQCSDVLPFHEGLCRMMSASLGYCFEYDAMKEQIPSVWHEAEELAPEKIWKTLSLRSVPVLTESEPLAAEIAQCGFLKREVSPESFAECCRKDWLQAVFPSKMFPEWQKTLTDETIWRHRMTLPVRGDAQELTALKSGADGYYVIADLKKVHTGYLTFSLEASAGTVLDIVTGEHLDDGRVRASIDNGFQRGDRYLCKDGRNEFTFVHRRVGCRYVELHIMNCTGPVKLKYLGMISTDLPLPEPAAFSCEDRSLLHARKVSEWTLRLCMHEHYEDTPWREQSLYAYDARQQMLYGYYLWGNTGFAAASLDLFGNSFDGDRNIGIRAPCNVAKKIPMFTMVWISAIYEHLLFSGSDAEFRKWRTVIDTVLERTLACRTERFPELSSPGTGKNIWNFCEWNGSLDGFNGETFAPYNLYFAEALSSAAKMHRLCGDPVRAEQYEAEAKRITASLHESLTDPESGFLLASPEDHRIYEHLQALSLLFCPVTAQEKLHLYAAFQKAQWIPMELSSLRYLIDSMMTGTPETRLFLTESLRRRFDPIFETGTASLWETRFGGDEFEGVGSLSHAWGAVFPYWTGACLLGVKPLTPGFRTFEVKPWCVLHSRISGTVPTPYGPISVSCVRRDHGVELTLQHPEECQPVVKSYPECPVL